MKDEQDGLREAYCETLRAEYAEKYRQLREEFERQLAERDEQLGPWTVQALRQYVEDTSDGFECETGCDSYGHTEFCPVTNTVAAFRLLRERLAERDERIRELEREYIQPMFDMAYSQGIDLQQLVLDNHGKTCTVLLVEALEQQLKAAQERLEEAERILHWFDYDMDAKEYFAKHSPEKACQCGLDKRHIHAEDGHTVYLP